MKLIDSFINKRRKYETSWIEYIKVIMVIKSSNQYKSEFGCKDFKEFCKKFVNIHEKTVYKMIKCYKFIKAKHSHILENKDEYIPNYGYIHFIFTKFLNGYQRKFIEKMVFKKATKKQIKDKIREFKEVATSSFEKSIDSISRCQSFAKSAQNKIYDLLAIHHKNTKINKMLKKVLFKFESMLLTDIREVFFEIKDTQHSY